jgi:hypothetical protein
VNKDDRDDIAKLGFLPNFADGSEPGDFSLGNDCSDTQVKIEAFLFIGQR